jgi:REP element-mobilizing transposase RayT
MPDHVHLIVTPQNNTIDRAMGLIKGGLSHRDVSLLFGLWAW